MLKTKNLTKIFSKHQGKDLVQVGIKGLNFEAKKGRTLGLLGANGAGKTTTLRILAGLTYPQEGEVILNNQNYKDIKYLTSKVSIVSHETNIYDRLTPFQILENFAILDGQTKQEAKKNILKIAKKLDMESFLHTRTDKFSTGMRQKVSIARSLINDQEILIFDEITNGLDIYASNTIKKIISKLKREAKTIIFSTHIMSDADELCDDLVILNDGEIVLKGDKKDLFTQYSVSSCYDLFFKVNPKK